MGQVAYIWRKREQGTAAAHREADPRPRLKHALAAQFLHRTAHDDFTHAKFFGHAADAGQRGAMRQRTAPRGKGHSTHDLRYQIYAQIPIHPKWQTI